MFLSPFTRDKQLYHFNFFISSFNFDLKGKDLVTKIDSDLKKKVLQTKRHICFCMAISNTGKYLSSILGPITKFFFELFSERAHCRTLHSN